MSEAPQHYFEEDRDSGIPEAPHLKLVGGTDLEGSVVLNDEMDLVGTRNDEETLRCQDVCRRLNDMGANGDVIRWVAEGRSDMPDRPGLAPAWGHYVWSKLAPTKFS